MRAVLRWSLRAVDSEGRKTNGSRGGFRWVDDRFRVLRVPDHGTARCAYAVDVATYAGVEWHHAMAIGHLMRCRWTGGMAMAVVVVQFVCSYLVAGIGQTQENPTTVVGYDVCFEVHPGNDLPADALPGLLSGDLTEGVYVGSAEVVLQARMSTKSPGLLRGAPLEGLPWPRFTHSSVDVRARPERVSTLVQWVARAADQAWHGRFPAGPTAGVPSSRLVMPEPDSDNHTAEVCVFQGLEGVGAQGSRAVAFSAWQSQPVLGMMRELRCSGWTKCDLLTALRRLEASTKCRVPTEAMQKRLRTVAWVTRVVREQWDTALTHEVGHGGPGLVAVKAGQVSDIVKVDQVPVCSVAVANEGGVPCCDG